MRIKKNKGLISSIFFVILTMTLLFGMVYGIRYVCYKQEDSNMPIYKVDTDDKKISLSFDVAWGSNNIDEILNILDKHNAKATFFLVGSWVDDNEELVKKIHSKGHELGNHSNTHSNTTVLSDEDILQEIQLTTDKIQKITDEEVTLYRPPFGEVDGKTMEICKSLGYQVIKWDIDSLDWKEIGTQHIIDRVIRNSEPGSIVLFHANVNGINYYLDDILTKLKQDNYDVVSVSELLYEGDYTVDSNGVQKIKK
ncbi:polysaccharide deacetylase family protein [Romboutsia sp. 13368]|uniref:polysaccharide deacetylase family protein n=1 Tax=Romboutsia sp. 13368 TaxID=2708053 RepID=UPI0025EF2C9C|nr:polysaccharide deacetylase family protein [Romboutsia sp. 13368]